MIRLSKLTDYGFVILSQFASTDNQAWLTARDLSDCTALPLPTVSKLLKVFSKGGVLTAQRGVHGGYKLARPAELISVADIIEVIDGPLAVTECACENRDESNACAIESHCRTKSHWIRITSQIRAALADITLYDMATPIGSADEDAGVGLTQACRGGGCNSAPGQPCACGDHEEYLSGDKQ